jgi:hypothetical protein
MPQPFQLMVCRTPVQDATPQVNQCSRNGARSFPPKWGNWPDASNRHQRHEVVPSVDWAVSPLRRIAPAPRLLQAHPDSAVFTSFPDDDLVHAGKASGGGAGTGNSGGAVSGLESRVLAAGDDPRAAGAFRIRPLEGEAGGGIAK